jgi:hypothetical protein
MGWRHPVARATEQAEAGSGGKGRGLGGAYISRRRAEGGAWGRWLLGARGAGRGVGAGGSERAEAPRIRVTRWGDLWAEAV